ncbi:MAG TPA: helix-turn-helix domain-containing protein, partial [Solirubrobacteraceae bacterium]|nr:helix-turn-helix domain-containing protein [Solirubrobacteraceae bacterium]
MNLVFSTSELAPRERLPALQEAVSEAFLPVGIAPIGPAREAGRFHGAVMAHRFDGLAVARFSGSSIAAVRTSRHIDASHSDDYLVALHTKGLARATQDGREITLRPGDLSLLDSARPYTIELVNAGPFEHLAYRVPRVALEARSDGLHRALAAPVRAGSDAGGLASEYLLRLAAPNWRTPLAESSPLIETGLDLLVTALFAATGVPVASGSRQTQMLARVKRHALAHLGTPDLSPVSAAEALYISPRQLHRLFAREQTTFGAWTREQRLRRCRRDLADERLAELSISQIARRWGYRSGAHFTRAFSSRFGV